MQQIRGHDQNTHKNGATQNGGRSCFLPLSDSRESSTAKRSHLSISTYMSQCYRRKWWHHLLIHTGFGTQLMTARLLASVLWELRIDRCFVYAANPSTVFWINRPPETLDWSSSSRSRCPSLTAQMLNISSYHYFILGNQQPHPLNSCDTLFHQNNPKAMIRGVAVWEPTALINKHHCQLQLVSAYSLVTLPEIT